LRSGTSGALRQTMTPDLFWIPGPWRGRLAIATRPRGGDWLRDEANSWRRAGIQVVVSLLEPAEASQLNLTDEGRAADENDIRFISFPIPDRGVPASAQEALSLIARMAGLLEEGKTVIVHCRQGVGRSGLIAAGVLMASGQSPTAAIKIVSSARGVAIPETPEQLLWAEQLPSGLPVSRR
jgi:protein-tyrosine phosphatase